MKLCSSNSTAPILQVSILLSEQQRDRQNWQEWLQRELWRDWRDWIPSREVERHCRFPRLDPLLVLKDTLLISRMLLL